MSGVFSRFHAPTGWEFVDNAVEIEIEVYKFVRNEKNIPKRSWLSHGLPLFKLAQSLNARVSDIKSSFPTNEQEVIDTKIVVQNAIRVNEQIIKMIQMTILEIPQIDMNKLDRLSDLLINETKLLRALKSSIKIVSPKQS